MIHISWERTPAMVRISIADNGDGIAEAVSYTHLDVYKRQGKARADISCLWFLYPFIGSMLDN